MRIVPCFMSRVSRWQREQAEQGKAVLSAACYSALLGLWETKLGGSWTREVLQLLFFKSLLLLFVLKAFLDTVFEVKKKTQTNPAKQTCQNVSLLYKYLKDLRYTESNSSLTKQSVLTALVLLAQQEL